MYLKCTLNLRYCIRTTPAAHDLSGHRLDYNVVPVCMGAVKPVHHEWKTGSNSIVEKQLLYPYPPGPQCYILVVFEPQINLISLGGRMFASKHDV